MRVRIYYHHTDCGGVVYYANYLKFFEEARSEVFEKEGIFLKDLIKAGRFFVVARQEIDYKAPAFYADTLEIDTRVVDISAVRVSFAHTVKKESKEVIVQANTVLVYVDNHLKPLGIPEDLRAKLERMKNI